MPPVNIARERSLYASTAERRVPSIQRDLSQLREQVSTGTRVNRPSDDPDAFAVAERMKRLGGQYARHEETIAAARPWVDRTQAGLDQLAELFTQAQEEGLRAANDTRSESDREAIAQRLESLKGEAVDQLNARYDGEYLFAGNRTGKKPFAADGQPAENHAAISGARERPIAPGRSLAVNVSGKAVHQMKPPAEGGPETITGALDDLIGAVRSGDTDAIEGALASTSAARDHVTGRGAQAGATSRRLSAAADQLEAASLTAERRRSEAEDTDYVETMSALQETQTRLQAALKSTASTLQTSLVDFLR